MKKIVILLLLMLIVILIYISSRDSKIYYLALGDDITLGESSKLTIENRFTSKITNLLKQNNLYEKTLTEFAVSNYRTTDLLNDIKNNKKLELDNQTITIKNAIIKAELITVSIGMNDFINYIDNYRIIENNIINLKEDMDNLLKELRNISKESIILIGIYNPKIYDDNLNKTLEKLNNLYNNLATTYDIYYLDIYKEINKTQDNNQIFLNDTSYQLIASKLINYIESDIIK